MRVVNINNLEEGMIVGRPIIDDDGRILLNGGKALTPTYIKALASKGFTSIYVADDIEGVHIEGDDDLNTNTRSKAILSIHRAFDAIEHYVAQLRKRSTDDVSNSISSDEIKSLMSEGGPFDDIAVSASAIMGEVLSRSTLAGLTSIKSVDSQLYHHSVDVCVIAVMIAKAVGLPHRETQQLAVGCLLHDIGKIFVDHTATEKSKVRQHTLLGYEVLKNLPSPDILVPHVALEHHEWQDGSGEPRGLIGSNAIERNRSRKPPIPTLVGEIAAVANIYDNMLTGSPSRPPMTPDVAVKAIFDASGKHLNREVVTNFIRLVPVYPLGTEVLVRSEKHKNFTGIVSRINPNKLDKPVIVLFRDNKKELIKPIEIDMTEEKDVIIRGKFG